jgi:hypothetical protein
MKADEMVDIYRDPTPMELKKQLSKSDMKILRALRLKDGRIFTWPAEMSPHIDAIELLIKDGKVTEADLIGAERLRYEDRIGYYATP